MIKFRLMLAVAVCMIGASFSSRADDAVALKGGEKVAFLGDSITQFGAATPAGYVNLVVSGLAANDIKVTAIPAGISGHKSNDMLARLDKDVLSKKPDWMTLSCGVNDVWHGANGIPLDQYKTNITSIVDQAQAAGIKVMLLTSTMIFEDQSNGNNQKLTAYNEFLRTLATDKKCLIADLNADMQAAVKAANPEGKPGVLTVTVDGVHMNPLGDQMMARGILKAFGLSDAQLAKAQAFWLDMPNATNLGTATPITLRQYQALAALAAQRHLTLQQLMTQEWLKTITALTAHS